MTGWVNEMNENHISEDQMVLFYYGEAEDSAPVESHLAMCEQCRAGYRSLQTVLNTVDSAPVPDRGAAYGSEVWKRIESRVGGRHKFRWFAWWMWAPAATALLLLAFFAGRMTRPPVSPAVASNSGPVRERILLVAVGDHLERSQMVLAEISNAPEGKGKVDISNEQRMAEDLLDGNRLYRLAANTTGDVAVASVLDDLERVLLEIANSPSQVDASQLDEFRNEIKERGLLFKIRVLGSTVHREESTPAPKQSKRQEGTQL